MIIVGLPRPRVKGLRGGESAGDVGVGKRTLQSERLRLFIDVTRICSQMVRSTPTGIDRIDLEYLEGALGRREDVAVDCVVTTPAFVGALNTSFMADVVAAIRQNWARDGVSGEDAAFEQVRTLLEQGWVPDDQGCVRVKVRQTGYRKLKSLSAPVFNLLASRYRLRQSLRTMSERQTALYLNTSHTQLEHGRRFRWLRGPGINPVFFVHDTIPVEYPEFCSPGSAKRHEGRLETVSRDAAKVIVNSEATKKALRRYWDARDMRIPQCEVVPLGISDCFTRPTPAEALIRSKRPYFVCVGTLEPRKNHLLLFSVWRELVASMGEQAPVLVLVGRRGWQNENICDVLERSRQLSSNIIEVSGLGDHGLAALMRSSQGLIAPSIVEGFGLPVAEALAMQVPVIASDIDAHREVAGGCAHLVNPHDSMGWATAIRAQMQDRNWVRDRVAADVSRYRANSGVGHVDSVLDMLVNWNDPGSRSSPRPLQAAAYAAVTP